MIDIDRETDNGGRLIVHARQKKICEVEMSYTGLYLMDLLRPSEDGGRVSVSPK